MPVLYLKMPRIHTLQNGQLIIRAIRLASACAIQGTLVTFVWCLSWQSIRPFPDAWLPILEGATWPFTCLILCMGPAPRHCLFSLQSRAGGYQFAVAGAISQHTTPASSESPVTWLGSFKHAGCCAALCRSGSTPSWALMVSNGGSPKGKEEKGRPWVRACLLSALSKTNICSL